MDVFQAPKVVEKLSLRQINGDLFTSPDSLVHCVSSDFHIGRGIATQFLSRYPDIKSLMGTKVGTIGVINCQGIFIYNIVTKHRFFEKPSYLTIENSLVSMRAHIETHFVTRLSMPRIGCELDKLDWLKVKQLLIDVFSLSNVTISIYTLKQ